MNIKTLLYLIIILITAASCNDDHFLNKLVLDKVVYHENIDQIGQFKYNSNGTVQRYEYYFDNNKDEYLDYLYSNGKLSAKNYYHKLSNTDNSPYLLTQTQLFTYSPNGEIAKAYLDTENVSYVYSFVWSNGEIVKIEVSYHSESSATESTYEMQYDVNGNVIKRLFYTANEDNTLTLDYIVEYEYDNKINPLFESNDPIDLLSSTPNNISPNNVVKMVQRSSEDSEPYYIEEIEYIYNEFDLPVEKTESIIMDGQESGSTIKFFYKKI